MIELVYQLAGRDQPEGSMIHYVRRLWSGPRGLRFFMAALCLLAMLTLTVSSRALAGQSRANGKIKVIAAENEYGSMVQAIGGNRVSVTSLLTNPNTDPHEFEASPSTARTLSRAQLVIKNGIGYDAWIDTHLSA